MLKAKKANRVMRIPDEKKDEYIALGYEITTMDGKIVSKPDDPRTTIQELKAKAKEAGEYAEAKDKEIESLKAQVADLEKKLAEKGKAISGLEEKPKEAAGKAPDEPKKGTGGSKQTK